MELTVNPAAPPGEAAHLSDAPPMKTIFAVFFLPLSLNPTNLLFLERNQAKTTGQATQVRHALPQRWRIVPVGGNSQMLDGQPTRWRGFLVGL